MVKLSIQWSNIFSLNQYGSDLADDNFKNHYCDVIMGAMASQITGITIVYSTVYSGADQRKHQSSVSLAFVRGIHWSPVNSPHKGPVTRKMFPFDDVIMTFLYKDTWILTECLLNITPRGLIYKKLAFVWLLAWRWLCDTSLSKRWPTWAARGQGVDRLCPINALVMSGESSYLLPSNL